MSEPKKWIDGYKQASDEAVALVLRYAETWDLDLPATDTLLARVAQDMIGNVAGLAEYQPVMFDAETGEML